MSFILPHRTHKPTIVATRSMFVLHNKLKRLALRQSTHSRCGMQGIQYISYMIVIIKFKRKVTPQMNQVCSPYCSRSFFSEIASKLFQTFCDIGEFLLPGQITACLTPCFTNKLVSIFTFSLLLYILCYFVTLSKILLIVSIFASVSCHSCSSVLSFSSPPPA